MTSEKLVPLESNPEVLTKFLQKLGVSSKWNMVDVVGLDSDLLSFVPRPVLAVMLLFPISESYEQHKKFEEIDILSKGQEVSSNVFYMKQKISNACGTVALVHGVANNTEKIELSEGPLKKFLDEAKSLNPSDRGTLFVNSEGIINAHNELAQEGQTNTPRPEDPVNHHFITFIHKDGTLYELDGNKAFPINHGPTTEESFLEDAAKACQIFMARDPEEVRFTVMALTASD